MERLISCIVLCGTLTCGGAASAKEWTTYRGNPQRTGNTDGAEGPKTPKVLWFIKSQDHFVASPLPLSDRLIVSSLGTFNVPTLYALALEPQVQQRVVWKKSAPFLKLPTVSTPAVADGKLVFGDGMHQTNGAILHCLRQDTGRTIWQFPIPGELVHLEGAPTIVDGRVYLGGGSAGILCIDMNRVTLDGREMTTQAIQKVLDTKWMELLAKYEQEKKTNPDFAIPPTEDLLPKPAPVKLWEQGKNQWHVDAPVVVAEGLVLVASSFLDKEKLGERALFALDAKTGAIKWKSSLKINPWGGAAVAGNTVVLCGSTASYDPKLLKGAKGDVVAVELSTGQEKWRKEVTTGGILACPTLTADTVITTATDGKVRAFNLADGERKWIYDAKTPIFAPVALGKEIIYAGDLKGEIHAIHLTDGTLRWKLDLGTEPQVKSPGAIYGGPVLHGGRLYVATCNLDGAFARQPTTVVCLGD